MVSDRLSKIIITVVLIVLPFSISGCGEKDREPLISCTLENYSPYSMALEESLTDYRVELSDSNAFMYRNKNTAVENFDIQALPALEAEVANFWYPHYLATPIIAIDRDRVQRDIKGWEDLAEGLEDVGLYWEDINGHLLLGAMSYGLEGENFSLTKSLDILSRLNSEDRLFLDSFDAPLVLCYDYQAANLKSMGKNIEILLPEEGTLTYEKGLISKEELNLPKEMDAALLSAGLRLLSGQSRPDLYPGDKEYERADKVKNIDHINRVIQDSGLFMRRQVLRTRLYSSADGKEHFFFAMVYIIIVLIWISSIIRRAMQKGIKVGVIIIGVILLGWILFRLIKYQVYNSNNLSRYLWFGYYIFQLSLPITLLWISYRIDRMEKTKAPIHLWIFGIINCILILLVLTNDLHNFVFKVDLENPAWSSDYEYGIGFYLATAGWIVPLLISIGIMVFKSWRKGRKYTFFFPFLLSVLFIAYSYGYINKIPFARESDYTMITGIFTILFLEASIQSGLIPTNTKYIPLFTFSSLNMQIIDPGGNRILSSLKAPIYERKILSDAMEAMPLPILKDDNTLLFLKKIGSIYGLWEKDILSLNKLNREIEESLDRLSGINTMLQKEERIERAISEEKVRTRLLKELEDNIAKHIDRLRKLTREFGKGKNGVKESGQILLLLYYIKRRCNLYFKEEEREEFLTEEIIFYFNELIEVMGEFNIKVAMQNDKDIKISPAHGSVFYELFYNVLDWATGLDSIYILLNLVYEGESIVMKLLFPQGEGNFSPDEDLADSIAKFEGKLKIRALEDNTGLSLSFPLKGGL